VLDKSIGGGTRRFGSGCAGRSRPVSLYAPGAASRSFRARSGTPAVSMATRTCTFFDKPGVVSECTMMTFLKQGNVAVQGRVDLGKENHTTGDHRRDGPVSKRTRTGDLRELDREH
jgi:hypothetical protein